MKRIVTVLALTLTPLTPLPALAQEGVSKWSVTDKISPLTNLETLSASLDSEEKLANSLNLPEAATLVVRCSEGTEAAYVVWPQIIERASPGSDTATVLWKVDDGAIKSDVWNVSKSGDGAGGFDTSSAQFLLKQYRYGKRLVVRITGTITQDAVFDLTGIEPLVQRIDAACAVVIPQIAKAIPGPVTSAKIDKPKTILLEAVNQQLASAGFAVTKLDDAAGTLTTSPLPMRLTTKEADCGKKWGIPYLLDSRARTKVSFVVTAHDGGIDVRTIIDGAFYVSNPAADWKTWSTDAQPLQCTSRGVLESRLIQKLGG